MDKKIPIDIPEFLNLEILELYVQKTNNKEFDLKCSIPPSIPLYYSINTTVENHGYELFKNRFTDTKGNAISFYKKYNTEYIMYHSKIHGLWIIVLKDNMLISAYPKMTLTYLEC
jgi:hypothetical protein